MFALALALLVLAAPTLPEAKALAQKHAWEELYLGYASGDPKGFAEADRKAIAELLLKGAKALASKDAVMAFSLAERSVAFDPTAPALHTLAKAARATQQNGTAEDALRQGLSSMPDDGSFGLELGELLLAEHDLPRAEEALGAVPKTSPAFAQAQRLLAKANQLEAQRARAFDLPEKGVKPEAAVAHEEDRTAEPASLTYESTTGPNGLRTRANSRFRFRYFNNERDFGQRADYEGAIAAALDEAYAFARQTLGQARGQPLDVILYTREEFALHNGEAAARQIAGLYSMGAIRMNDSKEITPQTRATLVHEYVHSVVDDACRNRSGQIPTWVNEGVAEYVEWRYEGGDAAPVRTAGRLRGAVASGRMPHLSQLAGGMLIQQEDPELAYAFSAMAVRRLMKSSGPETFMALIHDVGEGSRFDEAFQRRYGRDVESLDRDVRAELSGR